MVATRKFIVAARVTTPSRPYKDNTTSPPTIAPVAAPSVLTKVKGAG